MKHNPKDTRHLCTPWMFCKVMVFSLLLTYLSYAVYCLRSGTSMDSDHSHTSDLYPFGFKARSHHEETKTFDVPSVVPLKSSHHANASFSHHKATKVSNMVSGMTPKSSHQNKDDFFNYQESKVSNLSSGMAVNSSHLDKAEFSNHEENKGSNLTSGLTRNSSHHAKANFPHHEETKFPNLSSGVELKSTGSHAETNLSHIVFCIGASAKVWKERKDFIKLWWRPDEMTGFVWLDKKVEPEPDDNMATLPPLMVFGDTSKFEFGNSSGSRSWSSIRIARIVSETLWFGMKDVRWFVMGYDDTFFIPDNLVKVLQKYDHNQFYYIGTSSESHTQNISSYNMANWGAGFAISHALAKALGKILDSCLERNPGSHSPDTRLHACMGELGVPLTRADGFHQFDVYGSVFGLLAAHPVTPLLSLHHLDGIEPIFPTMNRLDSYKKILGPIRIDPFAVMQQSICYSKIRNWTLSISWGYAVQVIPGFLAPQEMEAPFKTSADWYDGAENSTGAENSRPVSENGCEKTNIYYLSNASSPYDEYWGESETVTEYLLREPFRDCGLQMGKWDPIGRIEIHKKPDPHLWDRAPRKNCCRVPPTDKRGTMVVNVGICRDGEIVAVESHRGKMRRGYS